MYSIPNVVPNRHKCASRLGTELTIWLSHSASYIAGVHEPFKRLLSNLKMEGIVRDVEQYYSLRLCPHHVYTPAPYDDDPPDFQRVNDGYTECHYAMRRWSTVPPDRTTLATDAGMKAIPDATFAVVGCDGLPLFQASTEVSDITEAEAQAVDCAIWLTPEVAKRVILTDSEATMKSRQSALAATGPLKAPTAGIMFQRWKARSQHGVTHVIKVESHFACALNDAADRNCAQDGPGPYPCMTCLKAVVGVCVARFPDPPGPLVWHKQAAERTQASRDLTQRQYVQQMFAATPVPELSLTFAGLTFVQTMRLLQLRSGALPVHSELLRFQGHVLDADVPLDLAFCVCCQGHEQETILHLFRCPALAEHHEAMRVAIREAADLGPGLDQELYNAKHLCLLAAGMLPSELQQEWPRPHTPSALRPAFVAALKAFVVLWQARCGLVREHDKALVEPEHIEWARRLRSAAVPQRALAEDELPDGDCWEALSDQSAELDQQDVLHALDLDGVSDVNSQSSRESQESRES